MTSVVSQPDSSASVKAALKGTYYENSRGIAVGKIFYFKQTASKTCFLELIYYVYLGRLGKHHNMFPLSC